MDAGAAVDLAALGNGAMSGGVLGVAARLLPDLIGMLRAKFERDHEYRMCKLSGEQAQAQAQQALQAAPIDQRDIETIIAASQQQKLTGVHWVDLLSATVRPVLMYWWMTIYTFHKLAAFLTLVIASHPGYSTAVLHLWSPDDVTILFSLISYFTLDRTLRRGRP